MLKTAPHISERVLGHVVQGIEKVYDHYAYFDEKRDALETWSRYLQSLTDGVSYNVIELAHA